MLWMIEKRTIKSLKKHPKNPRKLTQGQFLQLKASLEKFGLIDKPVITKDGTIIGGHQRIEVLKKMGAKEIECYVPNRDMSDKEIDELCIRLNKNLGEFDYDCLANEWDVKNLIEWGFEPDQLFGNISSDVVENECNSNENCPTCGKKIKKK